MQRLIINTSTLNSRNEKVPVLEVASDSEHNRKNVTDIELRCTCYDEHSFKNGSEAILENGPFRRTVKVNAVDRKTFIVFVDRYNRVEIVDSLEKGNGVEAKIRVNDIIESMSGLAKFKVMALDGKIYDASFCRESNEYVFIDGAQTNAFSDMLYIFNYCFFNEDLTLKEDSHFYYGEKFITLPLTIHSDNNYALSENNEPLKMISDNIVNSIIPEIVNNEKRQFIPCSSKYGKYTPLSAIEFNFHFRDRVDYDSKTEFKVNDNWKINEFMGWNGYRIDERFGNLEYDTISSDDSSDNLRYLGFTEDDIKYQKSKIRKSFIRLSFYSEKNPLSRQLLAYSTIFFDSGKIYSTYSRTKVISAKERVDIFSDKFDEEYRLSSRITVTNKYDMKHSSDGFYLYLFPSEMKNEKIKKTIYMKVEFNHAGYGKTIPLMFPNINGTPIPSNSGKFPVSFMKKDKEGMVETDVNRYYSYLMIPIDIDYDEENLRYVYTFPEGVVDRLNNKAVINLFEPRVKDETD